MKFLKNLFFILIIVSISSCRLSRNVPTGKYLLDKNTILVQDPVSTLSTSELQSVLRQKPNSKTIGLRFKLSLFNMVDEKKVKTKRDRKNEKLKLENIDRLNRQEKINGQRIAEARKNNKTEYTEKIIPLHDLEHPRKFFREWLKYKIGEAPVIFDSVLYEKSCKQIEIYGKRKGYYQTKVHGKLDTVDRRISVTYQVKTGKPYIIDSVYLLGANNIRGTYAAFVKKQVLINGEDPLLKKQLDMDYLESYLEKVAKEMRDRTYYGFTSSSIKLIADTNDRKMKVKLGIQFLDRKIPHPEIVDSFTTQKYATYRVNGVFFHLSDTSNLEEPFDAYLAKQNRTASTDSLDKNFLATTQKIYYNQIKLTKDKPDDKLKKGDLDPHRIINLYFNGAKPVVNEEILELQNYLEFKNVYKEYYLERSYQSLNQLNLFSTITPMLIEKPSNKLEVHYFLVMAKRQSFNFQPKFTSSFGLLGTNLSVDYVNRNLFRGGQKLSISFGGGFETQPIVFDDGSKGNRIFNTFEIGPNIRLDIPGLFPVPVTVISKRQKPKTTISADYRLETRAIFKRNVVQLNYGWSFLVDKTQNIQIGLPLASVIKYVKIDKSPEFESQISGFNDLFLVNTYSNQFIWEDFKLNFEYNNKLKDYSNNKNRSHKFLLLDIFYSGSVSLAGNVLASFKNVQPTAANGQHLFYGIPYSQFFKNENQLMFSRLFDSKNTLAGKLMAGFGIPYGNSETSMPYDYSFFAGGSNDNRGWRARSLGPGSYKYYLDSSRTATQIGDIRLGGSLEYRFSLGSSLKSALFMDFGNIWTYRKDVNRDGSQFTKNWYQQMALALGTGLRLDLDFFIIRLDIGFPIYNPALLKNARWVFNARTSYYQEGVTYYNLGDPNDEAIQKLAKNKLPRPFLPALNFGIGLPF